MKFPITSAYVHCVHASVHTIMVHVDNMYNITCTSTCPVLVCQLYYMLDINFLSFFVVDLVHFVNRWFLRVCPWKRC